jgi:hypothetical protein
MENKAINIANIHYRHNPIEEAFKRMLKTKVPIKKGCPNKNCFCTGACNEIIGFRDKLPNEY